MINLCLEVFLNLFSKIKNSLLVLLMFMPIQLMALNVQSLYTSACKREVGIIINVGENNVRLLKTNGKVKQVARHNIIFLTEYPMDHFPSYSSVNLKGEDMVIFKTKIGTEIVTLANGWPIGFTQDKIAIINTQGKEVVVERERLWGVYGVKAPRNYKFVAPLKKHKLSFVHPYTFKDCPLKGGSGSRKIYPQQVLSSAIVIKRKLDEINFGLKRLKKYEKEQRFYSIPQIYKNSTSLGLWHNVGYRHGGSANRTNNFTPVLIDSYASDVFDYQHIFITGSSPLDSSVHEESQTVVHYHFKASYFQFGAMIDPNLILVGRNYDWTSNDFDDSQDNVNDTTSMRLGFDFGSFSLWTETNGASIGMFDGTNFRTDLLTLTGAGMTYQNHRVKLELWSKIAQGEEDSNSDLGDQEQFNLQVTRINFKWDYSEKFDLKYSLIQRQLDVKTRANLLATSTTTYSSSSLTNAFYANYHYNYKYTFGGYVSIENVNMDFSNGSESKIYPKLGVMTSLSF